ncbi:SitI3 family protein [Catenuloplanes japonicus]|uniref:SitI3 family protein n=1 Tax=Catenuloplanes japonicus TaxID=33876 RepID=UPI00068F9F81|nr:SitI3 family protein [Catenuloplanes japonicus]
MGIEYRLSLAGRRSSAAVAARAMPELAPGLSSAGSSSAGLSSAGLVGADLLSVDLYRSHGFCLTIVSRDRGLVDLGPDGWELGAHTTVSFDMEKNVEFDRSAQSLRTMLTVVGRVLETGAEDAALVLNGDVVLLTRVAGTLVKYRRADWWDHYSGLHAVIRG